MDLKNEYKVLEDCIYTNPLILLSIDNQKLIDKANEYLPYSTGFEIECHQKETFDIEEFTSIPFILDVDCDSGEQRFRIPNGIKGLICLYFISQKLKQNSKLNPGSGIHYHIDSSDNFEVYTKEILRRKSWVLSQLDTWGYDGKFNPRNISQYRDWVRIHNNKTFEIRVGEMTFDYELLVKRIIHCNSIIQEIKKPYKPIVKYGFLVDKDIVFDYIDFDINTDKNSKKLIKQLSLLEDKENLISKQEIKTIIKKRTLFVKT